MENASKTNPLTFPAYIKSKKTPINISGLAIEIADFINAIVDLQAEPFNFERGYRIQTLVETINKSSTEGKWLKI